MFSKVSYKLDRNLRQYHYCVIGELMYRDEGYSPYIQESDILNGPDLFYGKQGVFMIKL